MNYYHTQNHLQITGQFAFVRKELDVTWRAMALAVTIHSELAGLPTQETAKLLANTDRVPDIANTVTHEEMIGFMSIKEYATEEQLLAGCLPVYDPDSVEPSVVTSAI